MSSVSLFDLAEKVLHASDPDAKLYLTRQAGEKPAAGGWYYQTGGRVPQPIVRAALPVRPVLVEPRKLVRRRLSTVAGRVALLHAVAHIEFTAIQLAWDHVYRFPGMPEDYYRDWTGVAIDEARHFDLIRRRLQCLGADYGDLPAHNGLWSLATQTADDVLARMALVPRFMEARGLDVTPGMIERLLAVGDEASVEVLRVILHEEVGHVALGSKWFAYLCADRGLQPETCYFELIRRYMKSAPRGPFNKELRLMAGFTPAELDSLQACQQNNAYI